MKHLTIIGLTGPAGSGKDTVGDLLVAHAGFTKMAFADPLKKEVADAFDVELLDLTHRETKEHAMSGLALRRCRSEGFVVRMIITHALADQRLDLDAPRSPRWIMQQWGTEYRRHQTKNYWIGQFLGRVNYLRNKCQAGHLVVSDCRFADEVYAVRHALGGQLWQITRPELAALPGGHVSEVSGSEFRPDAVIHNGHSVAHLQARVLEALEPLARAVA